jgi:3-methyladenine DNA glycosylase Tag
MNETNASIVFIGDLMGLSEGHKRAAEARKAEWQELIAHFQRANLPVPDAKDFSANRATTRIGWAQISSLLENEGQLTESAKADIARGLQQIDIQERAREIEERIKKGESIPDPTWPESSPMLSPDVLKRGQIFNIFRWTAIKELGLDEVEDYASIQRAAAREAYQISKERGDFDNFLENVRPKKRKSSAEEQEPAIPEGFIEVELIVPVSAFKDAKWSGQFLRYHPVHGLVQGSIHSSSYYDRGAGNSPGARGSRVTQFYPTFCAFLELVDLKKLQTLTKKSVMTIIKSNGAIVGREKMISSIEAALRPQEWFWSREEVEMFLGGEIESAFVSKTLPVEVVQNRHEFQIKFYARVGNKSNMEHVQ